MWNMHKEISYHCGRINRTYICDRQTSIGTSSDYVMHHDSIFQIYCHSATANVIDMFDSNYLMLDLITFPKPHSSCTAVIPTMISESGIGGIDVIASHQR